MYCINMCIYMCVYDVQENANIRSYQKLPIKRYMHKWVFDNTFASF